ncbi:Ig-like domain-containing protein [Nakamurella sp.]|uniref:L,D-transpeptidase n=1 Tax=Nakamurella sp. TaxID=1869182 RepID=UPI003783E546
MHGRRHHRWILGSLAAALLAVTAGCTTGSPGGLTAVAGTSASPSSPASTATAAGPSGSSSPSSPPTSSTTPVPPVATITATPALNSGDLAPADPITIGVAQGTIDALTMTNPDGNPVGGTLSADRASWTSGEPLAFGATYTVAGTATGTDGKQVAIAGTYSTVSPDVQVKNTIYPSDDMTVGVAAPIMVKFGVEPADKAEIAKHVTITTDPQVEGSWAWVQHDDGLWALDYRTKDYWPAGTKVHVEAKLYGVKVADGAYGRADVTSDFVIGRNQVVKADVNSHELVVTQDGQVTATYPASYGRGDNTGDTNLITRSGVHVVTDFDEIKYMSNPAYGYVNIPERWAVRISDNGEFIHANPASTDAQGYANVTHGCVNLSIADAQAYFHSAIWGDPVEVTGTSVQLGPDDGDIYDWGLTWDQWQALAAS